MRSIKEPNGKGSHLCEVDSPEYAYGVAINECFDDADGFLFVTNGEYGSQVNYCPFCGVEAVRKIGNNV